MAPLLIAAIASIAVFVLIFVLGGRGSGDMSENRQKSILARIHRETDGDSRKQEGVTLIKRDVTADVSNPFLLGLLKIPQMRSLYELTLKAGFYGRTQNVAIAAGCLFMIFFVLLVQTKFAALSPFMALIITWFLIYRYMKRRIWKRNESFVAGFPDAIDIIVRSVRSGHPLNTALRMISENTDPPVSTEFKQVVDEVAYGRTLIDALGRMGLRVEDPDLQFFIVVLSVQQETGSNLAEVLSNLSGVIRKRKQLRLKIKAMTSEGRATAWVLGGLPVLVFGMLKLISPKYLDPLFSTTAGQIVLFFAAALIVTAFTVVNQMAKIDI